MKKWKFGEGQTARQERREISDAKKAGQIDAYMEARRWRHMVEAESSRKRTRRRRSR